MGNLEPGSSQRSEDFQFDLSGGVLCLDFINTLGDRPRNQAEHLHTYGDLLAWCEQAGTLDLATIQMLTGLARKEPSSAKDAFAEARELRENLYRVVSAFASGGRIPSREFAAVNGVMAKMMSRSELVASESGFHLRRTGAPDALDQMLWSVLRSAVELLTSGRVEDIRECEGKNCSWLFLDNSRTRRKKWCDMKVCGNRAKARRHYRRTKKAGATKP